MPLSRGPKLNRSIELPPVSKCLSAAAMPRATNLVVEQSHAASPAGGGRLDLYWEAAHLEAEWRQWLEIGQLLHMTITNLAASLVTFPDDAGIAGLEKTLVRERERRVPAPAIGAGDAHALV